MNTYSREAYASPNKNNIKNNMTKIDCLSRQISYYPSFYETTSRQTWSIDYMVDCIRYGYHGIDKRITRLRATKNKDEYDRLKKYLPAVTIAGTFSYREDTALISLTPYVCLDFDHIQNPDELKKELTSDEHVYAAFISPGGNGIKTIILTDNNDPEQYRPKYRELMDIYSTAVKSDSSCQNLSRLTYISYDPDIYFNPYALPYHYEPEDITGIQKLTHGVMLTDIHNPIKRSDNISYDFLNKLSVQPGTTMSDKQIVNYKEKQWRNAEFYKEGNRQTSLLKQASALCSYGVEPEIALDYLKYKFGKAGLSEEEIETKTAYCYRTIPFGDRRWEVIKERDKGRKKAAQFANENGLIH